jgi:transcriptional regulator of acetoin/glycerol metabolism
MPRGRQSTITNKTDKDPKAALKAANGNIGAAAEDLGCARATLTKRLRAMGIGPKKTAEQSAA